MNRISTRGAALWRNRTVQVVLASTLLAPLGVPLIAPTLPVVRDAFGVTDAQASLLVSAYFLVGIVVSPFLGLLADRIGRKRVLVPALVVFSVLGLAGFFAPNYPVLLALRAVQGTAAAALFVTTVTIIGDTFEGVQRNAVLGLNVAVLSVGAAVFPVVGGALAAIAWNVPFLAYALGFPVALLALLALDEPTSPHDRQDGRANATDGGTRNYLRGASATLTLGMGALLGTAFLTEFLLFGTLVAALPFLLTAVYGLTPLYIGVILMLAEAGSVVAASANGRLARTFTNDQLIALGFVCYAISLAGVYVAPSPAFVALAVVVFGFGLGFSMPAVDAAVSERVTRDYRAGLLGLRNSTTFLGRATGPIVFVTAAAVVGYRSLFAIAAVCVLTIAVVAVLTTRTTATAHELESSV
ncbi:MFS transporter [Haladaptatus sp. NG-WS-4]